MGIDCCEYLVLIWGRGSLGGMVVEWEDCNGVVGVVAVRPKEDA
jgi:hypothetical protein